MFAARSAELMPGNGFPILVETKQFSPDSVSVAMGFGI